MSSLSPQKQQQQQCRRIQQSRNTNAYFDRNEYPRQYWQSHRNFYSNKKGRYQSYYDHLPPRHRPQQQQTKPQASTSLSSTNSDASTNRKDLHTKNLAAAAIAARQQNSSPQTNLNVVQNLMNSLILQQQQQQPAQSQSSIQLQYQLTNALLVTMIQQRLKEATLQAQAQQIQAALPTLLAAQALAYQQQTQPPNIAHPGTKFNNRPLVKFPVPRSNTFIPINRSRHRLGLNSNTNLPTYQQIQEIERGISLDEAIHSKGAIDITTDNHTE